MVQTIILIAIGSIFLGLIISYILLKLKKPIIDPVDDDPYVTYESFLHEVETVLRNKLSDEELKVYLESIKSTVERYSKQPGFNIEFDKILDEYNVVWPYGL